MARALLCFLAALAALFAFPAPAAAHAGLAQAEPSPGAVLDEPPAAVRLEFTERLDPAFSRLRLIDERGAIVAETTEVSPESPLRMVLELEGPLPRGSYTALWRVRSAEDGHVTEGVVPFGVGVAADLAIALPPPGSPAPALAPPDPAGMLGRWLALAGAALAVGALSFGLLAWRPAWRDAPGRPAADAAMAAAIRRLVLAGAILALAGAPLSLLSQARAAAGSDGSPLVALPALLLGPAGLLLGGRLILAATLVAMSRWLEAPGAGEGRGWPAALLVGALLLLTFPLTGHGAAAGALAPALVALGFLHVAAMAVWLGGLPALLVAVVAAGRGRALAGPPLASLVRRFSTLALAAVGAVALSGVASGWAHVGDPGLLPKTTYGRALAVKNVAFLALLGLGALHMLVVQSRLRPGGPWARRFRLTLGLELALAVVVLLAASVQLTTAPSRAAWAAQEQVGQRLEAKAGDEPLVLWVTPGRVGDNLLALDLDPRRAGEPGETVLFRLSMLGHDMAPLQAEAERAGDGRYQARGGFLSMVGRWEIEAIVRRPGRNDVRHTFTVDVRGR